MEVQGSMPQTQILSMAVLFLLSFFTLLVKPSLSETMVVDGSSVWKNPSVYIGDTIIFKHRQHFNLYIFHSKTAFQLCNYTQAVLLSDSNSNSFRWHPSRFGYFYFVFNNGSLKNCQESEQFPIKVSLRPSDNIAPSPEPAAEVAPSPTSGGVVPSTPARQWRFLSPQPSSLTLPPAPATTSPILPDKGGGIPFITSNPAVPLPTEADAATVHPIPLTSGSAGQETALLGVGLFPVQIVPCLMAMLWMMLFLLKTLE